MRIELTILLCFRRRNEADMELISIRDLYRNQEKYVEQTVTVGGWLRSVRDSKTFGFLVVHDGTFLDRLDVGYSD